MVHLFDVSPTELIEKAAEELSKNENFTPPIWSSYVKTGAHKERPPLDNNWWHIRCAAILRSVAKLGPVGVSKLRTKYGGRKDRGNKPAKFYKGSGSVIRKSLQQLQKAGFVKEAERGTHKGRIITPQGKSLLDKAALSLSKPFTKPVVKIKVEKEIKAEKKETKIESKPTETKK